MGLTLLCPVHSLFLLLSLDLQQDPEAETLAPHLPLYHSGCSPPALWLISFCVLSGLFLWTHF